MYQLKKTMGLAACALAAASLVFAGQAQAKPKKLDDIGTTAIKAGNFKTLVKAIQAVGLADTIMGTTKFTVFAPTDAAFAKLPAGTVENLLKPENRETLKKIVSYHVLAGVIPASKVVKLPSGTNVKSVEGENVIVRLMQGKVMIDPGMGNKANVTKTDIMASNGVIHVVDTVLIPPSVQRAMMNK